jgi:hypothetical protein
VEERHRLADNAESSGANPTGVSLRLTRSSRRHPEAAEPPRRAWVSSYPPDKTGSEAEPIDSDGSSGGSSGGIVGHLQAVAEPVVNVVEPFVGSIVAPVAGAIGRVIGAASQAWSAQEATITRRVRRLARKPLANLYELHPEARLSSPRELGMRFVPVEEIRGTAVAGISQRGGDFLPLKPFRGENWAGRWRRIRQANKSLQPLPPIDLIKFDGDYWVVDGHNRVAATLYADGVGLDAMVTELIPLDGQTSERPTGLLSYMGESGALRAAAQGLRPAVGMRHEERDAPDGVEITARDAATEEVTERYPARESLGPEVPD